MDLHYLEIFDVVARYESYKKASDILHISQPALSVQIKKLESQIGLKLFDKIGNRIRLSENGVMLKEYTQRIFRIVNELENTLSDSQNNIEGTLNIGGSNTPGSYILPEMIGEFKATYPNTRINLHIGNTSEICTLINNGTLDIALNGGNCNYNEHTSVEKLFNDRLLLVCSYKNPYANCEQLTHDDLCNLNFIVHKADSQLYSYYIKFIQELNLPENIVMCLGNIDAIKHAVNSNLGVSLMPYEAVKTELQNGQLKELNVHIPDFQYAYSLIYNRNKALTPASKRFLQCVRGYMKNYEYAKGFIKCGDQ